MNIQRTPQIKTPKIKRENTEEKKKQIKKYNQEVRAYKQQLTKYILTSRFTNATHIENAKFRKKNGIGCIYCSPEPIAKHIPVDAIIFMLEMNNDINKIIGIGMMKNHPSNKKYKIYETENYNRNIYVGKHRIDRTEMTDEENIIMTVFDILCFTGNKHMKRGHGLKSFPINMLYNCSKKLDLITFISNMFKQRMKKNEI